MSGITNVTQVSAGGGHTVAVKTDGTLWAWGNNSNGQLGDGDTTDQWSSPVQVGTDTHWASVAAGFDHTVAVKTDGTLWAWGSNSNGQLGDGATDQWSPVQVGTDTHWASVAAGNASTVAVKIDGTLWAWGSNWIGQLGLGVGDMTDRWSPMQVGTDTNWA